MACGFVRDWMMFSAEDVPQKKHKADAFPTIYIYTMLYKLIDPIGIKYSTYYTYACVYIYILMPFVMLTYIIYICDYM